MNESNSSSSSSTSGPRFLHLPPNMPSILSEDDKETVKRAVPKQSNKIHAVAVVRLYVAYPNRSKWTYTGLQGAVVLCNDLVGHTFWLKLVDISVRFRFPSVGACRCCG